jgi:CheY-like chemotaxis protein
VYRVTSDDSTVRLRISVEDTGRGIKEEDKDHLWESFQRLDEQHNRGIEGTGLGLAITHKYIELMGSCLRLNSKYGEGSEFWFDLDQGIVDPEPIGDFEKNRKSFHRSVDVYSEGFEAPDAHILVVDDVKLNLVVIKGLLKNSGMNIDTAESGAEAIEKMRTNKYDIVFLDHMMPEMDGMETLTRIISDPEIDKASTPIIALTANAISGVEKMYREHGFDDYLSKPIDPEILEKMLIKYLPDDLIIPKTAK